MNYRCRYIDRCELLRIPTNVSGLNKINKMRLPIVTMLLLVIHMRSIVVVVWVEYPVETENTMLDPILFESLGDDPNYYDNTLFANLVNMDQYD